MLEQANAQTSAFERSTSSWWPCHDLQQLWRFGWNSVADICCSLRASPGRDNALMKRNLIVAAFTLTVLAVAGCGAGDGAVKPAATSTLTPIPPFPTSSPTPTTAPKPQPAV